MFSLSTDLPYPGQSSVCDSRPCIIAKGRGSVGGTEEGRRALCRVSGFDHTEPLHWLEISFTWWCVQKNRSDLVPEPSPSSISQLPLGAMAQHQTWDEKSSGQPGGNCSEDSGKNFAPFFRAELGFVIHCFLTSVRNFTYVSYVRFFLSCSCLEGEQEKQRMCLCAGSPWEGETKGFRTGTRISSSP